MSTIAIKLNGDYICCEMKGCFGKPTQGIVCLSGVKFRCVDHEVSPRVRGTYNTDISGVPGLGRCHDVIQLEAA